MDWPKIYGFRSESNPCTVHETRLFEDGYITCSCQGFATHSHCWHIKAVKAGHVTVTNLAKLSAIDRLDVRKLIAEGSEEAAVERIFEIFPNATRDEVVDILDLVTTIQGDENELDETLPD